MRVQYQFAALVMSVGLALLGGAVPEATLGPLGLGVLVVVLLMSGMVLRSRG